MKKLEFKDFKFNENRAYFKNRRVEICLEPCLNGCDVAVYDKNQNLLTDKVCTDVKNFYFYDLRAIIETRTKALTTANRFYELFGEKPKN